MPAFSKKLGNELLHIARETVNAAFSNRNLHLKPDVRKKLSEEIGVFVNIYKKKELRGSFGYPPGTFKLADGIKRAARGAAFMDPRFRNLTKAEFTNVRFEVVLIKEVKELKVKKPEEYFKKINPKKHGLMIRYGPFKAMQLPIFAMRRGFTSRDYLEKTIEKSGLAPEEWKNSNLKVYTFTTMMFSE
ncbi:hypothetical protein CMO88_04070 [Candidatus Woesearchaeota archaeon]|nr:hypothetical protein [Candidatus Woesearchaeota archaeon]|tara:strand:+ start:25586 stop:26149 length:564 start_codon:yes stop_codon:yes gene_type:complete